MSNNYKDLSISMLIEKDIEKDKSSPNNIKETKPLPLKNNFNINERQVYQWVQDKNAIKITSINHNTTVVRIIKNARAI